MMAEVWVYADADYLEASKETIADLQAMNQANRNGLTPAESKRGDAPPTLFGRSVVEAPHPRGHLVGCAFAAGDIVSRDGSDRQRVVTPNDGYGAITVECVVAPTGGWCAVGDRESNLAGRYMLISRAERDARAKSVQYDQE